MPIVIAEAILKVLKPFCSKDKTLNPNAAFSLIMVLRAMEVMIWIK